MSVEIKIDSIKLVPIKELKLNDKNRNHHPQDQIEELARHYSVHGMRTPIIVSNQSGRIVAGNGRFLAALRAGLDQVPVSYQDFETPEKEYAFGIADNGLSLWSELDMSGINNDLSDLGPDFNIDDLGLKDFTLDVSEKYADKDPDEIPEVVEPKANLGEIYKLGNHRLMCGDSTKIEDVEKLMNGEKADMVFTDPPYGVNAVGGSKAFGTVGGPLNHKNKIIKANVYKKIEGDDSTETAINSFPIAQNFSKDQIFWGAQCYAENLPPSQGWIVWDKDTTGNLGDGELAWTNQNRAIRIFKHTWNGLIKESEKKERRCHPTQKPIALAVWCLENYSKDGKSVLDLFGGSGSTLIACEKTNRKCFMMELDPHYVDVIIARWEKFTGQKAELING